MKIEAKIEKKINYAAAHLGMQKIVSDIKITEMPQKELAVRISSEPEFFFENKQMVDGKSISCTVNDVEILLNDAFYRSSIIEAIDAMVKVEVYDPADPEAILAFVQETVHVEAYLHWESTRIETIPAFMQPNDPLVQLVLHKAGEYAKECGVIMCGYQTSDKEKIKKQVECIYKALVDMKIHYYNPQASFELRGQKIRLPHQVLHEESKQGTCLDLAILFATCVESLGLNAGVVFIYGHAFAGYWSRAIYMNSDVTRARSEAEVAALVKALAEFVPVECTLFREDGSDFAYAVQSGMNKMNKIEEFIDVEAARRKGIVPVYTFTDKPICETETFSKDEFLREEFTKANKNKLDSLKEQAVNLSSSNRLLNCEADKTAITMTASTKDFLLNGFSDQELNTLNDKFMSKKKDKETLHQLYNKNKRNMRENGNSSLYLAFNELRWQNDKANGEKKTYVAPLYLCPAEIYRNGRGDYMLRVFKDKVFFNPSLKVMLSQVYQLDGEKLMDQPGTSYENQMELLAFLIEHQKGWSVKEDVCRLALFTVADAAIINALNEPSLEEHEIVRGILDGEMNWDNNVDNKEEETKSNQANSLYVYDCDSSQSAIIKDAFKKKAQIVVGPAGNGKTQTNVIAMTEAYELDKSVLFVSEKAVAQEVAYKRLNDVLKGYFNLHITSNMDKNQVFEQIKKTLDFLEQAQSKGVRRDLSEVKDQYNECYSYIENYYSLMTRTFECGKTLEELVDMYSEYADCQVNIDLEDAMLDKPLLSLLQQTTLFLSVLDASSRAMGNYSDYIRYDNLRGEKEQQTYEAAKRAVSVYQKMEQALMNFEQAVLGDTRKDSQDNNFDKKRMLQMITVARALSECEVYNKPVNAMLAMAGNVDDAYKEKLVTEFAKLGRMGSHMPAFVVNIQKDRCRNTLDEVFPADEVRYLMNLYSNTPDVFWNHIQGMKFVFDENGRTVLDADGTTGASVKDYFDKLNNVCNQLGFTDGEKKKVCAAASRIMEGEDLRTRAMALQLSDLYNDYGVAQKVAAEKIVRNEDEFARYYPDVMKKVLFEEWLEYRNNDFNRSRSAYDKIVNELEQDGLMPLVKQIKYLKDNSDISNEEIERAVNKAWIDRQINRILSEHSEENNFDYFKFQNKVKFLESDETEIRENLRDEIMAKVLERMPNLEEGVSNNKEFGVLQKLVRQKNTTIRTLFEQTPNILKTIFPCMIMDPVAVAKYIPADFPKFDLTIIDEGSQMPTYNAIIPISRANGCMIFGDEKQLQVMDEFKKRVNDEDDNLLGRESILTSAYITSMPRAMLRFHYRSENESLIAFSNKHYYNNSIVTFPSSDTTVNGVSYEFVANGIYDMKGCKGNREEAAAVIRKITEVFSDNKDDIETLGVITLNVHQRDLILSMLKDETRNNSWLGKIVDDYVDVINLESCQGQEWDYVIISPGFGNDENGQFHMGFGAINKEDGVKRLNVMLTRAKKKMTVITSIEPYMLANAKSEGVKDFREFLKFAKGEVKLDNRICNKEDRVPGIVNSVATALEARGYEVHTNIGSSDFKVDIGVVSKDNHEKYNLGIVVDHFHDTKSNIHDRELTYAKSLENKGWNIYRLRYLNWKEDAQTEILQILKMLQK